MSDRQAEDPKTDSKNPRVGHSAEKREPQDAGLKTRHYNGGDNNDRDNNYSWGRYGLLVVDSFVYSGERVAWDLAMGSRVG